MTCRAIRQRAVLRHRWPKALLADFAGSGMSPSSQRFSRRSLDQNDRDGHLFAYDFACPVPRWGTRPRLPGGWGNRSMRVGSRPVYSRGLRAGEDTEHSGVLCAEEANGSRLVCATPVAGSPNQAVSASASPCWAMSPTQATYPSGRIITAAGSVTTPSAGSSHGPIYLASIN
jgi:hypothetical protein